MLVISGSPSLVSANSLIESLATDAATRSGCWRNTAREKPSSSRWRVVPGGNGTVCPGDCGLCNRPSMPPRASVSPGDGHSARSSAGISRVPQSAAAAARPYSGVGPLLASPKCPVTK
jgi:hypothetical protein